MIDYLDPDVAYLLGLIAVRGQLVEDAPVRKLVISFPFKSLEVPGVKARHEQKTYLKLGATDIRDRLHEVLGTDIRVIQQSNKIVITATFLTNAIAWRDLNMLLNHRQSYHEFLVPEEIVKADSEIQREFIRGIADGSGWLGLGPAYGSPKAKRKIVLAVDSSNWLLPVQLCSLCQQNLKLPINEILWGHPNLRDPHCKKPSIGIREHQIRSFCRAFVQVGFGLEYKNDILTEFVDDDNKKSPKTINFCNPLAKRQPKGKQIKGHHPQENSAALPPQLAGKHYDAYWQICLDLGCKQGRKVGRGKAGKVV